uniref:Uncharacterized protein n=1 Tax=Triticum urartu TaxID=4572 RepID=A0A8R7QPX6_TRIUA
MYQCMYVQAITRNDARCMLRTVSNSDGGDGGGAAGVLHPGGLRFVPRPRADAGAEEDDHLQRLEHLVPVQHPVPHAAEDAVVGAVGLAVVRGVLRARHQHAGGLQRLDAGRQPAAFLVRPCVELLAQHHARREGPREGVRGGRRVGGGRRALHGGERERDGARQRVQVVAGLPARDGGGVAVVALEGGDLRADEGRGGVPVVVDEPVVDARGEVGDGVGGEGGGQRLGVGAGVGGEGGGRGERGEHGGRAGQRPRALRPRGPQLVRIGAGQRRRRRRGRPARRRRAAVHRREGAAGGQRVHG